MAELKLTNGTSKQVMVTALCKVPLLACLVNMHRLHPSCSAYKHGHKDIWQQFYLQQPLPQFPLSLSDHLRFSSPNLHWLFKMRK
jgi:hypothetical protein